jgi:hypothetical protein
LNSREDWDNIFGWELIIWEAGEQDWNWGSELKNADPPTRASELAAVIIKESTNIIQSSSALSAVADETISLDEPVRLQLSSPCFSASSKPGREH